MDRLDVAILRNLYGPTPSAPTGIPTAWSIARRVDAHGATVKRRLARLRGSGILHALRVAPAPALLGASAHFVEFGFPDARAKARGLATLADDAGVVEIHDLVGEELAAWVYAYDGASPARRVRALSRAAGATRATIMQEWAPSPARWIDALDARILHALAPDGHRPMRELTKETRVTPKTIRARLRALAKAGAFVTYPSVSFGEIAGATAFVLRADVAPGRAHAALLAAFPDHVCASLPASEHAFLYLVAPTSAAVGAALDAASRMQGVRNARVRLARELRSFPEKVRARLARVGGA